MELLFYFVRCSLEDKPRKRPEETVGVFSDNCSTPAGGCHWQSSENRLSTESRKKHVCFFSDRGESCNARKRVATGSPQEIGSR